MRAAHFEAMQLDAGRVDVWITHLDRHIEPHLLQAYQRLLSDQERARLNRIRFEADHFAYLVSRALVRTVLSRFVGIDPAELCFGAGENGKPYLNINALPFPALSFNLSHTRGMAVLAVSCCRAVGIDVESVEREAPLGVAVRNFARSESTALFASSTATQSMRFWRLWTLKESYVKATGRGLSFPLDQCVFDFLDNGSTISFKKIDKGSDCAERWWYAQWQPSPMHIAALCVERSTSMCLQSVTLREILPLSTERQLNSSFWGTSRWSRTLRVSGCGVIDSATEGMRAF